MSLTLTRRPGERVRLTVAGLTVWITVRHAPRHANMIQVNIDAPPEVRIDREELLSRPVALPVPDPKE